MTEPAITRARLQTPAVAIQPDALPVEDQWADIVFVTLAAHEIRDAQKRERFFHELHRVVSPHGHVLVIEHLRDLASAQVSFTSFPAANGYALGTWLA